MMLDFEKLKVIHDYRTASTLRGYAFVFLSIFPILFSPSFAMLAEEYGLWAGIFTALITSLMFVTMGNIQAHVEDPFDCIGADAINLDMLHEIDKHMF
jgi:predicted membrane chloride channel (bestrophin family)